MKPVAQLDGDRFDRLRQVAGVELSIADCLELIELARIYQGRFEQPTYPLFMQADLAKLPDWQRTARRAFVEAVYGTWSNCRRRHQRRVRDERRRKPKRPLYDANDKHCIKLICELLKMTGEKPPSDATLRYDLTQLKTGRERRH